jgi:hypothetical protein
MNTGNFKRLLAFLGPDRERAGIEYEALRRTNGRTLRQGMRIPSVEPST